MQKLRNLLGGRGGGHQKITLDYRGEGGRGGGLGGPKKDYVIFEWSLIINYMWRASANKKITVR